MIVKQLLSIFTYKKPKDIREFYIPEYNENNQADQQAGNQSGQQNGNQVGQQNANQTGQQTGNKVKEQYKQPGSQQATGSDEYKKGKNTILPIEKEFKKPLTVSELNSKKEKENTTEKVQDPNVIATNIQNNIDFIKQSFNAQSNKDIIIREFTAGGGYKAFIAFIDGMADRITINNFILRPLLKKDDENESDGNCGLDYILESVIETNQAVKLTKPDDVIYDILIGNTCLYVDGCDYYVSSETKGYDKRSVEKPQTEGVVRGSQEGFNENLRTNVTLIRRVIKNKDLTTEFMKLGERNKNLCAVMYIKGLTNPAIVDEVKRRINGLKTDFIAGSGMLEQFIEENTWSLVPTILSTERPDRAASHIVEGKVVIIAEGTPFALVVPVSISTMFHTPEDASLRWQYGTMLRFIRIIAVFIATFAPGFYVALTNFHREMIPTELLIAIAKARENIPFPTIVEVLAMEISFELIREAGIRIPGIIGNTIGIIGALILGQAAVQANLVSPVMIIIVAITGLGNFAIPDFSMAFAARIYRIIFILLGAMLGFYGITLGIVVMTATLSNTKSFGVPLLSFIAPKLKKSNDVIVRKPVWMQEERPDNVNPLDKVRQPEISRQWTVEDSNVPEKDSGSSKKCDNSNNKGNGKSNGKCNDKNKNKK